ncbi:unnamed protein product [Globisporangium polare]
MIFACGFPLYFWGDAVESAAFILNRSPTRANAKRASPFEVLTKQVSDMREIVVFGLICTFYRDPHNNNSLQQRRPPPPPPHVDGAQLSDPRSQKDSVPIQRHDKWGIAKVVFVFCDDYISCVYTLP